MYCSRRLYKGNSYEICLPLTDSGITSVRFYTRGDVVIEKEPVTTGDSMCFELTADDLAALGDGVLRYEYEDADSNTQYVIVTPGDYSGSTLDDLLEGAFDSGYTAGMEDCSGGTCEGVYEMGYDSGYTDGAASVDCQDFYDSGYTSGRTDGFSDGRLSGMTEQAMADSARLTHLSVSANSTYEADYGYSVVVVDVAQTGYTQQDLDNAFNSGWTAGYNSGYSDCHTTTDDYLTMEILSAGTIQFAKNHLGFSANDEPASCAMTVGIEYSLDNGATWTAFSSDTVPYVISVDAGDKLMFRGDNPSGFGMYLNTTTGYFNSFSGSTAFFNLSGYLTSIIAKSDFQSITVAPGEIGTFGHMFMNTNVVDASALVIPSAAQMGTYTRFFQDCKHLTTSPVIPTESSSSGACDFQCSYMFSGCSSLTSITAYLKYGYTAQCYRWVEGVSAAGTFTTLPNTRLTTGINGIPSGWTVVLVDV